MPMLELPTGLIFAGINVPDHDLLFQQIAQVLSSPTPPTLESTSATRTETSRTSLEQEADNHVVILQSKDCVNLKTALKSMIEQFLGLGIAGAVNPLEVCSTSCLQIYSSRHRLLKGEQKPLTVGFRYLSIGCTKASKLRHDCAGAVVSISLPSQGRT